MNHHNPTYKDSVAVISGLTRLEEDLLTMAVETQTARNICMSHGPAALDHLVKQLRWLAGDVERMQAALGKECDHDEQ